MLFLLLRTSFVPGISLNSNVAANIFYASFLRIVLMNVNVAFCVRIDCCCSKSESITESYFAVLLLLLICCEWYRVRRGDWVCFWTTFMNFFTPPFPSTWVKCPMFQTKHLHRIDINVYIHHIADIGWVAVTLSTANIWLKLSLTLNPWFVYIWYVLVLDIISAPSDKAVALSIAVTSVQICQLSYFYNIANSN